MTPDEITTALKIAADQKNSDDRQDIALAKISRVLKKLSAFEQLNLISAYQASLILEIAGYDKEKSADVWRAAHHLSGVMMRDFYKDATDSKH